MRRDSINHEVNKLRDLLPIPHSARYGASKMRRDHINMEVNRLRDLLPIPHSARCT